MAVVSTDKAEIVALSQIDVLDEKELKKKAKELEKACGRPPLLISAATHAGMTEVLRALRDIIVSAAGGETALPDRSMPIDETEAVRMTETTGYERKAQPCFQPPPHRYQDRFGFSG